ncbi:hypothetical protein RF11_12965 [Thelohanellus kitauei]|uniref:Uncharacterized protein n=1 Tax=Thelohanellus kitauei TaxID=669202 RepID=A0A0C2J425_THEKT|nr:hypothetical protein RF11_12965 [Thelohanellus kitauei]
MDISTYQKRFEHKPFVLPSKTVTQTTNDKTINTNFISIKMDINGNTSSISKYHIYSDNLKNEMPSYDQTKEFLLQSIERNTKMKDLCKSALKKQFQNMLSFAKRYVCRFGSTYRRDQSCAPMTVIKTSNVPNPQTVASALVMLESTSLCPDVEKLVSEQKRPVIKNSNNFNCKTFF